MQYKNLHSKLRHTIININITETNNLQIYNINISPITKQIEYIFHTIIIRRPQSGRPKTYTCSHVSLLRPPLSKAGAAADVKFSSSISQNQPFLIGVNLCFSSKITKNQPFPKGKILP